MLTLKEASEKWVRGLEKVWDFYFDIFIQRFSNLAPQLSAADRIAVDCYQTVYSGLGHKKEVPSPSPYCYVDMGFTPLTYRRGVRMRRLGRLPNPFPLIRLPYARIVNPWTLGSVLHEVSHDLQSDLGLWQRVPRRIHARLLRQGLDPQVAAEFARWHKEIWADLAGVLLGGPAVVPSLMDVVARSPARVLRYRPGAVHPTPFLRPYISTELLRRMGFTKEADALQRLWIRIYPNATAGNIPEKLLKSFHQATRLVVDTIAFVPYQELGGKTLAQVVQYSKADQQAVQQAAARLASGRDPGSVPPRFLIGAARWALDQKMARPEAIARNFYSSLARR